MMSTRPRKADASTPPGRRNDSELSLPRVFLGLSPYAELIGQKRFGACAGGKPVDNRPENLQRQQQLSRGAGPPPDNTLPRRVRGGLQKPDPAGRAGYNFRSHLTSDLWPPTSPMSSRNTLGGVIHTYQQYDPVQFPSPTQPPPDLVSPALEHMLMFGERRELTEEELARAIRLDPSQIAGLGPSIDALIAMLAGAQAQDSRPGTKPKTVRKKAHKAFHSTGRRSQAAQEVPRRVLSAPCKTEQIRDLERLWYAAGDDQSPFAARPGAADRTARRQVPGRRARRQVRVHRPRSADRAAGARR